MSKLSDFLSDLFRHGRASVPLRPDRQLAPDDDAREIVRAAYARSELDLAGPPVPLDERVALAAARVTHLACWFLVNRAEPDAEVERAISLPDSPRTSSQHLSADLTLRYLPAIHRRARARAPDDVLTKRLVDLLRGWPFSGVLADLAEPPTWPLDLGAHRGLSLEYAERLARLPRPGWAPSGSGLEYVDWVFRDLGLEELPLSNAIPLTRADDNDGDVDNE